MLKLNSLFKNISSGIVLKYNFETIILSSKKLQQLLLNYQIIGKFFPSITNASDYFGYSVDINDNYILVGSPYNDNNGNADVGRIFLFNHQLNEITTIAPNDGSANDRFGTAVNISKDNDDYLLVGSYRNTNSSGSTAGSVYVYEKQATRFNYTWSLKHKIIPDANSSSASFGQYMSIHKNFALISASNDASGKGSVYLYDYITNTKIYKMTYNYSYKGFGYSLDMNDNYIVVGVPNDDKNGLTNTGNVIVYDVKTGNKLYEILPNDSSSSHFFGYGVSINDNNILSVGAYGDATYGSNSGASYLFELNNSSATQLHKITSNELQSSDYFGKTTQLFNDYLLVGAYGDDDVVSNAGAIYAFDLNGNQINKIKLDNDSTSKYMGMKFSCYNKHLVVGSLYDGTNGGSAGAGYFIELI